MLPATQDIVVKKLGNWYILSLKLQEVNIIHRVEKCKKFDISCEKQKKLDFLMKNVIIHPKRQITDVSDSNKMIPIRKPVV